MFIDNHSLTYNHLLTADNDPTRGQYHEYGTTMSVKVSENMNNSIIPNHMNASQYGPYLGPMDHFFIRFS